MINNTFISLSKYLIFIFFIEILLFFFLKRLNFLDNPSTRKIHNVPKLTIGGLLFIIPYGILNIDDFSGFGSLALISFFMVIVFGIYDDLKRSGPKLKLFFQILSSVLLFFSGSGFKSFLGLDNPIILLILTVFYYVSFINIINLIDGADGLAAGISIIILSGILVMLINTYFAFELILLILCIGIFMIFNIKNSLIFMGDCGSNFLGVIIAFHIMRSYYSDFTIDMLIPFILLIFYPFADTVCAIIRRFKKGKSILSADKDHTHHILIRKYGLNRALFILFVVQIVFTVVSVVIYRNII